MIDKKHHVDTALQRLLSHHHQNDIIPEHSLREPRCRPGKAWQPRIQRCLTRQIHCGHPNLTSVSSSRHSSMYAYTPCASSWAIADCSRSLNFRLHTNHPTTKPCLVKPNHEPRLPPLLIMQAPCKNYSEKWKTSIGPYLLGRFSKIQRDSSATSLHFRIQSLGGLLWTRT